MTLFTQEEISVWVEDFRSEGEQLPQNLRMIERDLEEEGLQDAGLVVIRLGVATTGTYLERPNSALPGWRVCFMERDREIEMSPAQVHDLAAELVMIARLATYLEARTGEALAAAA